VAPRTSKGVRKVEMLYQSYHVAHTLEEAVSLLESANGATVRPIAGGTDLMLQLHERLARADVLVDISGVPEIQDIRLSDGTVHVGAAVTYSQILDSAVMKRYAPLLTEASRTVGATQIRNMGTVGGNLGTASPAGDSLPPLYALDASVTLTSSKGERNLPITAFIQGYRRTDLRAGELIKEISFPALPQGAGSVFVKFGLRQSQAIAVVNVSVVLHVRQERVERAAVALGAVAPMVVRSPAVEKLLLGQLLSEDLFEQAGEAVQQDISPIDDVRGSAAFRRHLAGALLREALASARRRSLAAN